MNALADPFKQLVERRLWPIALLLVVALVAVPFLLAKKPDETVLPTPTAAVPAGQGSTTESVVTLADAGKQDKVRAVLGDRKDPFRPAQLIRVKKENDLIGSDASGTGSASTGSSTTSTTGGATDTPVTVETPVPTATATPAPTYELYSLKVRFGTTDGELATRTVKRLTGLPGGEHPAALYLGLLSDHKSAVFILDAGVAVLGDGHCDPSPTNCQTLTMREGETEFLTRGEKQWELDLVDIHVAKTTDKAKADESRKAEAGSGRKTLRGMVSRVGPWSYDAGKGTLKKLPKPKAAKRMAKHSRFAAFTSSG